MESAYKGIVVKESLQTNPTLSKRWFSCKLDDCDDVFRFAICNMQYAIYKLDDCDDVVRLIDHHGCNRFRGVLV